MISIGTLIFMILDLILGFAVPVCLAWWMIRKYKVRLSTILIGAATFIVFALVLEALVHKIVLGGSLRAYQAQAQQYREYPSHWASFLFSARMRKDLARSYSPRASRTLE